MTTDNIWAVVSAIKGQIIIAARGGITTIIMFTRDNIQHRPVVMLLIVTRAPSSHTAVCGIVTLIITT